MYFHVMRINIHILISLFILSLITSACKQDKQADTSQVHQSEKVDTTNTETKEISQRIEFIPARVCNKRPNEIRKEYDLKLAQKYAEVYFEYENRKDVLLKEDKWDGAKNSSNRNLWLYEKEKDMIEQLGVKTWIKISEIYKED